MWIKPEELETLDTGQEGLYVAAAEGIHIGTDGKLYMVVSVCAESNVVVIDIETAKVRNSVIAKLSKPF